jgi:methyl-accepting chemotaxis protein
MYIQKSSKKVNTRSRKIKAEDEVIVDDVQDDAGEVEVAPEATDLLFEAEDVAELIAEVTGEDVAVEVDDDKVTFEVADDTFEVVPEGDEEILEASRKVLKGKKSVKASRKVVSRRPIPRRK